MQLRALKRIEGVVFGLLIIAVFAAVLRELAAAREERSRLQLVNQTLAAIAKSQNGRGIHA